MDGGIWHKEERHPMQGAVIGVYREMGRGFEVIYPVCNAKELSKRGKAYDEHPELHLFYQGERLRQTDTPDFIGYGSMVFERKALSAATHMVMIKCRHTRRGTGIQCHGGQASSYPCRGDGLLYMRIATTGAHQAHVLNYLKATGMCPGLPVDFGRYPQATVERRVL